MLNHFNQLTLYGGDVVMTNREQRDFLIKLHNDLVERFSRICEQLENIEKEVQEMKRNDQSGNNSSQSK